MEIPVARPDLAEIERHNLLESFDSGWISSKGKFVDEFELRWAKEISTRKALAVANGTVALHLALKALGIGPGDEVIVPSLTFIATANAVTYVGATPVFCEVNRHTWNVDVEQISQLVTSKTRAIICVHLYGVPCEMDQLLEFAANRNLLVIEDAAEAPFSTYMGKSIGSFGVISTFSFYGNKIITCGEGGAVCTNDEGLYEKMRKIRDQGMSPRVRYYFDEIGYNFRLTNMQSAILCAQLERVSVMLENRHKLYRMYDDLITNFDIIKQETNTKGTFSPWLYTILLPNEEKRLLLQETLAYSHVETRPIFIPVHSLPPYASSKTSRSMINTESISARGISLPTFSNATDVELERLSEVVLNSFRMVL